jgi:hypothetical protein
MKSATFWDITPCSPLKANRRFGGTYRLHPQGRKVSRARNQQLCLPPAFTLVSCSVYSPTLKMEAICSSETSVRIYQDTVSYPTAVRTSGILFNVGFEVLTAVVMKSTIFWDLLLCSPLSVNRRFGGTYCLHLQSLRVSQTRKQHEAGSKQSSSWLILLP